MPNYWNNLVTITHADPKLMKRFLQAYGRDKLGQEFLPMPDNFRRDGSAEKWRSYHWGTNWDFGQQGLEKWPVRRDGIADVYFDSATDVPFAFYLELIRVGFQINVKFNCTDACVCGRLRGSEMDYYEIKCFRPACVRKHVDRELVKDFSLDDGVFQDGPCTHKKKASWVTTYDLAYYVSQVRIRDQARADFWRLTIVDFWRLMIKE